MRSATDLTYAGIEVVEVNRPNRQLRRQRGGKSDSVDAEGAARAAASGQATAVPKSGVGPVECIRMLLVARQLRRDVTLRIYPNTLVKSPRLNIPQIVGGVDTGRSGHRGASTRHADYYITQ